jgi:hypothetical protein
MPPRSIAQLAGLRRDDGLTPLLGTRRLLPIFVLVAAACGSVPQTVTLPNGATGYMIDSCPSVERCENRAREICGGRKHFVHERNEHRITARYPSGNVSPDGSWGSAGSVVVHDGNDLGKDPKAQSWVSLVVECDPKEIPKPSPDDGGYAQALAEYIVARERNKREYMDAVCKLKDAVMRRQELNIAREQYGNVACP